MNSQCTRCSGAHELADCPWPLLPESEDMKSPHKHAELIKAWADGARIEWFSRGEWISTSNPMWDTSKEYRIKPEPPEKVYPLSVISWDQMLRAMDSANQHTTIVISHQQARAIANAAIRDAIDYDQVVSMAEVQEVARNLAKKDRDARDLAIAEAVVAKINEGTQIFFDKHGPHARPVIFAPNLAEIIASVKG